MASYQPEVWCYAYAVLAPGNPEAIKIGSSMSPITRLAMIAAQTPFPTKLLAVFAGGRETEKRLLQAMRSWRMHGEWVRANPVLDDEIARAERQRAMWRLVRPDRVFVREVIVPMLQECERLDGADPVLQDFAQRFAKKSAHGALPMGGPFGVHQRIVVHSKGRIPYRSLMGVVPAAWAGNPLELLASRRGDA